MRRERLDWRTAPRVPGTSRLSSEVVPATRSLTSLQPIAELVFETIRAFVSLNDDPPIMRPRGGKCPVEPRGSPRSSGVGG